MAVSITADRVSLNRTRHTASRTPDGWSVTWLPGRVLTRDEATTAVLLAESVVTFGHLPRTSRTWALIDGWAAELDLTGAEVAARVSRVPAARVRRAGSWL